MSWKILSCFVALACAAGPGAARSAGPAFACAAAQSAVERLICKDSALAALDRQLDAAYRSALAQATAPLARQLRAQQRGWVKGRDDCWKAEGRPTWITATWTVDTVRGCVEAQYRLRTSELQAVWRLRPPRTLSHACADNPTNEVVTHLFDTDPPTIRLERGDRTATLWQVGDAGAGRYEGGNVVLELGPAGLALTWLDTGTGTTEQLRCTTR